MFVTTLLRHHLPSRFSGESIPMRCKIKHMTADERRIATAALGAGPWASHDQIVIAVADGLGLGPTVVEAALMRLRISEVLYCVHYVKDSVCYEEGKNWADEE
jgi:hypothetical protein